MIKKRLSKKIWYGSDVDSDGKPVLPPLAKDSEDLEGLHYGELYLHIADDKLSLWTRTLTDQIKQIGGEGSGGELWQLKETENGEKYIFSAFDVATQKGITMYANGGMLDLPSIYDGLLLDNDTIYWEEIKDEEGNVIGKRLKARVGSGEGGSADFSSVFESGSGNAYTSFVLSEDGKGLTFVKGETFAKQSDYEVLNNKVSSFLEGSDTDNIINKWKELESFLSGMKESDSLSTILSYKADKSTTLSGYGITDAYTKTQTNSLLEDKADWGTTLAHYGITNAYTKTEVGNLLGDYLPITGGTIEGNLRLRVGSEYTSPYLYFGDSSEVWLKEASDTHLTIHAQGSVALDTPITSIDGIEIKKSASGVLFIDGNLVVSGGITMYGTDGTAAPSIWDGAPVADTRGGKGVASFDPNYFTVDNGVVKFIGQTGGGIESITKQMVIDALGYTPYNSTNPNGYITSSGSITGNADTATNATNAANVYTNTSSTNFVFPVVFASNYSKGNQTLFVDSASGAGYNPYSNTFVASYFNGDLNGNADTATELETSRTLWGQSFDGSSNVSGDMTNVGHIKPKTHYSYNLGASGNIWNALYTASVNIYDSSYGLETYSNGLEIKTASLLKITRNGTTMANMDSNGDFIFSKNVSCGNMFNITSSGSYNRMRLWCESSNNYANGGATFLQAGNYAGTSAKGNLFLSGVNVSDLTLCKIYGPLLVTSGITMYSDERKKTILNHVELSLKEVADAPLIEHYYNSDEAKTTHVGSVAQYWAGLNDWFCKEDGEGFLTMEIQNAALASAISVARELTRYESKTDKQIKKLRKRIGELEEEIENLKNK